MSFISPEFLIFFGGFFCLYYLFPSIRVQNTLIVLGSYIFYGWWDWRFLSLLLGISLANYVAALVIEGNPSKSAKRTVLITALSISFLALGFFKYFGFFSSSFAALVKAFGIPVHPPTLNILLPLGISFMTFQGVAYVVDVYRGEHEAERDLIKFLGFKAFFPQLVAGPIERASNLLDQFGRPRSLDSEKAGRAIWLLIYGYTLKMVVADNMAPLVDAIFIPSQPFGWSVVLGTLAFGLQIYADFCGYSLIAKGAALLLGFELVWNFQFPYWAVSISDFWRRWHISLSNWLRDYLYIPLGGNRHGRLRTARNLLVTMGLGGLWHGASWNFVFWGLLHGTALAAWRFLPVPTVPQTRTGRIAGWAVTMVIVFCGWFLFRATSFETITGMVDALHYWEWVPIHTATLHAILALAVPLAILEWFQLRQQHESSAPRWPAWVTYPAMSVFAFLCLAMSRQNQPSFIYFQF